MIDKMMIDDYFGSKYKKESKLCIQNINVFHSCPVLDYRISTFIVLVQGDFSQSQAFNFQNFLGKHALKGLKSF